MGTAAPKVADLYPGMGSDSEEDRLRPSYGDPLDPDRVKGATPKSVGMAVIAILVILFVLGWVERRAR